MEGQIIGDEMSTKIREKILESFRKEMIGPHFNEDGEAILPEYPYNRYFTGILSPTQKQIEETEMEELGGVINDDESDNKSSRQNMQKFVKQSTVGLTFVVTFEDLSDLEITAKGGYYTQIEPEEENNYQFVPFQFTYVLPDNLSRDQKHQDIQLTRKDSFVGDLPDSAIKNNLENYPFLSMVSLIRKNNELCMVTIAMSNTANGREIENYIFSVELEVASKSQQPIFKDRRQWIKMTEYASNVIEDISHDFLHRKISDIAVGHGVAVEWDLTKPPTKLVVNFIPAHEVTPIIPRQLDEDKLTKMDVLATSQDCSKLLLQFIEGYKSWYDSLVEKREGLDNQYKDIAKIHLRDIQEAINRIEAAINLISTDDQVKKSFQLMNQVMSSMRQSPLIRDKIRQWRPFQLAFILYSLEGIARVGSKNRKEVDLLWFPTGGGKTEAYLGLMAFTLIYRRLRGDPEKGSGTGVLSRYTLRLLTLQQFQRTTALVCALELLRVSTNELGKIPFSIGLWVGNSTTPGSISEAKKSLNEKSYVGSASMKQFQECPWCGAKISSQSFLQFNEELDDAKVCCLNDDCPFKVGIPAYMIDDQIFEFSPSIILGTVDKFARVPKLEEPRKFLASTEIHDSPDLIVQDELHLINGPLGSMYGLYEMMVQGIIADFNFDNLPKVISSTATVKRARTHIERLYARNGKVFPPVGFEAGDSYWAVPAEDSTPGRLYVGLHPQGKSPTNALKAVSAHLLAKAENLKREHTLKELDPYWTLVGYFSSLRELGAAMMLAVDVIPDRIKQLSDLEEFKDRRPMRKPAELTSRLDSEEIAQMLDQLNVHLDSKGDEIPIDSVFATNMISVGVDVSRLSSMVVVGQPKSTAEYIQATARVGRRHPGLVVTLYNWTRPRDRSHYEKFLYYHSTLNTHVDPLSATPFSLPARERALHAVLIGIVRHAISGMNKEGMAGRIDLESPEINQIMDFVTTWTSIADIDELAEVKDAVQELMNQWELQASNFKQQVNYVISSSKTVGRDENEQNGLMVSMSGQSNSTGYPKRTPDSMRNVEHSADFKVISPKNSTSRRNKQ